jgi:hypothetical protein
VSAPSGGVPAAAAPLISARGWAGLLVGLLLIGLGPMFALVVLRVRQPARVEPAALGFDPPGEARNGRGFALGVHLKVDDCDDDVEVTVVATGTAEFWLDRERMGHTARFAIALPDARAEEVRVTLGASASDVTVPQDVPRGGNSPAGEDHDLTVTERRVDGELLIVEGRVKRWLDTLAPVVVHYRADWLADRGLGSCYLSLPALTGDRSMLSTQIARGLAYPLGQAPLGPKDTDVYSLRTKRSAIYNPTLEILRGGTTVEVLGGDVDGGSSLPPPGSTTQGSPRWGCAGGPSSVGVLRDGSEQPVPDVLLGRNLDRSGGVLSDEALARYDAGNCSAVAVVVQASASYQRDLVLLAVGALVSLGFTILIETVLRLRSTTPPVTPASKKPPAAA